MDLLLALPLYVTASLAVLLGSTVAFDVVHATLHAMAASRLRALRALGALHETHHRFLDRQLRVHPELISANLRRHVVPEYLTQASFSALALLVLPAAVVLPAFAAQTLLVAYILRARGLDVNHRGYASLRAYRPHVFCLPEYHAWHHAHPEAHFSSWIKLLDWILGTGSSLAGRHVALSGAATPFGAALRDALAERGHAPALCYDGPPPEGLRAELRGLDVLVLCHDGEAEADYAGWIEAFCDEAAGRLLPPEVWALGRSAGFLPRARRYFFRDPRVVYRQLAPVGAGPAPRAARTALDFALRGFNFAPTARSPRALCAFLRFRAGGGASSKSRPERRRATAAPDGKG